MAVTTTFRKYLPSNILLLSKYQIIVACTTLLFLSTIRTVQCANGGDTNAYAIIEAITNDYEPNLDAITSTAIAETTPSPSPPADDGTFFSNLLSSGFVHAFVASLSVILVSELGDKTFFIAAIMAMQHSRLVVFGGAMFALGLMTILSAVFGLAATFIPHIYTFYISTALFVFFGLKMLWDGYHMSAKDTKNELEEVQSDIRRREIELKSEAVAQDAESGPATPGPITKSAGYVTWKVIMQAFTMTFLAEWGDRSQLTTIVLAAREDIYGIMVGGCLGHAICTGAAVIGGRLVAQRISVRHVTLIGGVVFLIFAVVSLVMGPNEESVEEIAP